MGQGIIEYRGQIMMNCRESFLRNVGEALREVAMSGPFEQFQALAENWVKEVSEMPPGCSLIRLDKYLLDEKTVGVFSDALRATLLKIDSNKPGTRELIQQLLVFLKGGYDNLKPVYQGKPSEQ